MSAPLDLSASPFLERSRLRSLLAFRFWDAALDRLVSDRLRVSARPADDTWPERIAHTTPQGLYAFTRLPNTLDIETPSASDGPIARSFWVEVHDLDRRFVSVALEIDLFAPDPGIEVAVLAASPPIAASPSIGEVASPVFSPSIGSPPGGVRDVFHLFSAPARAIASPLAAVRGQLEEIGGRGDGPFAGHAVLVVEVGGRRAFGLADAEGRFVVPLTLPPFNPGVGSPPTGPRVPMDRQRWDVRLGVRYEPSIIRYRAGARVPDLRTILAQRSANIFPTAPELGGTASVDFSGELRFTRDLVLRSEGRSTIAVEPA